MTTAHAIGLIRAEGRSMNRKEMRDLLLRRVERAVADSHGVPQMVYATDVPAVHVLQLIQENEEQAEELARLRKLLGASEQAGLGATP